MSEVNIKIHSEPESDSSIDDDLNGFVKNVIDVSVAVDETHHLKVLKSKILVHEAESEEQKIKVEKFVSDAYDVMNEVPLAKVILQIAALFPNLKTSFSPNKD